MRLKDRDADKQEQKCEPERGGRRRRDRVDQRQALRQRQELAPGKAGRYCPGNCPGCGDAPIEACRKADGDCPLLRFVLDGSLGCLPAR
jgi:hypothetical protein